MSKISTALRAAALGPAPARGRAEFGRCGPHDWLEDGEAATRVLGWREDGERFNQLQQDEQRLFLLFVAEAEE